MKRSSEEGDVIRDCDGMVKDAGTSEARKIKGGCTSGGFASSVKRASIIEA